MSAMNPVPSPGPSTEKRAYEPSMEEILASIRRIIADDQSLPGRGGSARDQEAPAAEIRSVEAPTVEPQPSYRLHGYHEPIAGGAPEAQTTENEGLQSQEPHSVLRQSPERQSEIEPHSPVVPPQSPVGRPSPIQWAVPEPVDEIEAEPTHEAVDAFAAAPASPASSAPHGEYPAAHGSIAAPQYAGPIGHAFSAEAEESFLSRGINADLPPTDDEALRFHEAIREEPPESEPTAAANDVFEEPIEPPQQPQSIPELQPLFSSATDTSVSSAFNLLAASRLAANSDEIMNLVREMLRPLLRNWLDDNLPSMVERMVRDEIERVARGGH